LKTSQAGVVMNYSNPFVIIYIIGLILNISLDNWLEFIDYRNRVHHGTEIPPELSGKLDPGKLLRTCTYENAKYFLWIPENAVSTVLQAFLLLSGFYPWLFTELWGYFPGVYVTMILFVVIISIPETVISLPFALYGEFHIEKKFGFSTMTFRLWLADRIKGVAVSAVLGLPLMLIMLALLEHTGGWWWLPVGLVFVVFSFGISVLYPRFIAPLFNKFTPVPDGELKARLSSLMEKTGFKAEGVYMMDASKRSRHSNAYFTGFGRSKRIVLFDTLVNQLTVDEIEAVLGHELGHYKKHHILKRMLVTIPLSFISLYVASLFVTHRTLYAGFGFETGSAVFPHMQFIGLFLLSAVFGGYGDLTRFVGNWFSRRDEFAADAYAAQLCGSGQNLASALVKLNSENLSEITPPKIYSIFNYSHPPLLERIRALNVYNQDLEPGKTD